MDYMSSPKKLKKMLIWSATKSKKKKRKKENESSRQEKSNHGELPPNLTCSNVTETEIIDAQNDSYSQMKDNFRIRRNFSSSEMGFVRKYLGKYINGNMSLNFKETKKYVENSPELSDLAERFGPSGIITKIRTERKKT